MRKLLNRLLLPAGYRIERVSRFKRELDALHARHAQQFRFVQIGANDGVRFDDLYLFATTRACAGIVVEPLPDMYERLRANYADYPRIVPVDRAVHATAVSLPLFRVAPAAMAHYEGWASGIASFDRDHLLRHGIAAEHVIAEAVACLPLMRLLENYDMLNAHLLQIDTEGYDAQILRMIDFARFRPSLIKYEHKNIDPSERASLTQWLGTHGYRSAVEGTDTVAWTTTK
jgi:FkbM family methyltransferase